MTLPVKHRLAAILAADAVGYIRMMGADGEGTLKEDFFGKPAKRARGAVPVQNSAPSSRRGVLRRPAP